MNVIDTSVWLYRHDSREPIKQQIADQLLLTVRPLLLPWQVGCEFIAASRKLAPLGFTQDQAWAALADLQRVATSVILPDPGLWLKTRDLQNRYSLSFWDAVLLAACIQGGAQTLYTEDMGAPRTIDGLALVNPFLPTP